MTVRHFQLFQQAVTDPDRPHPFADLADGFGVPVRAEARSLIRCGTPVASGAWRDEGRELRR